MPVRTTRLLAVCVLASVATACTDSPASSVVAPSATSNLTVGSLLTAGTTGTGRYLVGVAPGGQIPAAALNGAGAKILASVPQIGMFEVSANTPSALRVAGVRYIAPSFELVLDDPPLEVVPAPSSGGGESANGNPSGSSFFANGVQWDMKAMKADFAWANSLGGLNTSVCIVDSGIDKLHVELTNKLVAETSFVSTATIASPAALDSNGHGTHVASTVTGNGVSMASVAPDAKLMAAKVFAATGGTPIARVVSALVWCADRGAHVVNMSLGGLRFYPERNPSFPAEMTAYGDAVKYATDRGVVVVVSAGNSNLRMANPSAVVLPAQVPGTVIVGATGPLSKSGRWLVGATLTTLPLLAPTWNPTVAQQVWMGPDSKAFYSNFGTGVHVFAPGGVGSTPAGYINRIVFDQSSPTPVRVQQIAGAYDNIWAACSRFSNFTGSVVTSGRPGASAACSTTQTTTRYASLAGTSMAAPHVAGLAALLYGELAGVRSVANRAKVENCIKSSTDNIGPSTTFGGGRVNAQKALACVKL